VEVNISMKLKSLGVATILASLLLGIVTACQPQFQPGNFTDDLGREISIEGIPQRIISLAPSNTEVLFALGLEDRVVGVTEFCDYPEAALDKPKVGGFSTVDVERVVALEPDLILATSVHETKVIPILEKVGLTVVALAPETLDEVLANIILVGKITGRSQEATQLVTGLEERVKVITDKTESLPEGQRPRVFYLTWHDPLMTPGSGTRHDDVILKAGGTNVARDLTGYAGISLEVVVDANPEVIIAGVGMGSGENLPFQFVQTEPRLMDTDARRNNRVYEIDVDLVGRPGPRIVDALEKFAEFIHPELFREVQ
jgi:iron complex transport system substrate-binding protein